MSYQIKDILRSNTGIGVRGHGLAVTIYNSSGGTVGEFRTADLLDAVRAECHVRLVPDDAIVIERAQWPEIVVNPTFIAAESVHPLYASIGLPTQSAPADFRRLGVEFIVLAEYLDAHPPIDDEQTKALRSIVSDEMPHISYAEADAIARRLVEAGARIEVKP